ncbi:MAG: hypothetical protein AB7D31_15370 [Stenotrophomonas sp.]
MADLMQQARAQFEAWATARGKPIHRRDVPSSERHGQYGNVYTQQCWEAWEAAALRAAPEGYVLVPVELALRVEDALGRFVSDEGWGSDDMAVADDLSGLLAAHPQGVSHG